MATFKAISSVDLTALINELQPLVRGKLSNIYHLEDKEFLFQIHTKNGKQYLKVVAGKWLCLTTAKETPLKPSSFCAQLRKYLDNATINDIQQYNAERVVVISLEKKEKFSLIIELFSKGNLILTDNHNNIITLVERQIWKDRTLKPGEQYIFPASGTNWKTITEKEIAQLLSKSDKKNLATALATELGLGGTYAEELCQRSSVDKNILPSEVTSAQYKKIFAALNSIKTDLLTPKGYVYTDQVIPFALQNSTPLKTTATFSEALDGIIITTKASPYQKKIITFQKTIEDQEESCTKQENAIKLNT